MIFSDILKKFPSSTKYRVYDGTNSTSDVIVEGTVSNRLSKDVTGREVYFCDVRPEFSGCTYIGTYIEVFLEKKLV